jgi:integrase
MFPASPPSFNSGPTTHLYDLVATSEGIHVSPNCVDGHVLIMELLQHLGLVDQMRVSGMGTKSADREAKGDWNGSALPILVRPSASVSPSPSPAPIQTPKVPQMPAAGTAPIASSPSSVGTPATCSPSAAVPVASITHTASPPSRGKLLSELMALNLANLARGPKKATPATRDRKYILGLLLNALGDKPVTDITAEDANSVADVLASWPRYLAHYPEMNDLSPVQVAAIAKKKKLPVIQRSTQGKHIMALNAFFNWCVKAGAITENPFHYVQGSRYKETVPKKRDIFSAQDLQSLFAPKHLRNYTEPHKLWVPLIALFTGMRVNEIAQLYADDIQSDTEVDEDGAEHTILYFDITPFRDGQSIKTGYSKRRVPVPRQLLDLGFEHYVADIRASGSQHLFPGLAWGEGGPGRTLSRWFNTHHLRQTCGIKSAKKSLHCFRHTLTTRCERKHVPNSIIQTINGHSDGQGVDQRSYVARGSLLECKRAMEGLRYPPLELVPYTSEQFAPYLAQAAAQRAHGNRIEAEGLPRVSTKGRRPKLRPQKSHMDYPTLDLHTVLT